MKRIKNEIKLCNPKLIITLSEVPSRIIRNKKSLKNGELFNGEDKRNYIDDRNI